MSGVAADGAGAPPAGPPSGGEASHSPRSKITHEQFAALRAACFAARRDNDDRLPIGWIKQQAEALGVTYQTVYSRLYTTMREPLPATKPAEETRRHQHTVPPDAEPPRLAGLDRDGSPLPARKSAPDAEPELVHTETPACWCRRQPANRDNVWCKLRRVDKPVTAHPALRKDPPRAERYKVRRMHGTYGGG